MKTCFLNAAILLLIFPFLYSCSSVQKEEGAEEKEPNFTRPKNVLLIIGDDHSARVLGCYGNDKVNTPNLDRLATEGVRFSRAYANAPLCSASRQSILTGKYPHATGVTLLTTSFPDENITIAEMLGEAGYKTGIFGKTHFNNQGSHGFQVMMGRSQFRESIDSLENIEIPEGVKVRPQWKPFKDPARIWLNADMATSGLPYKYDQATFFADRTIDFIKANKNNQFFATLAFFEPHSPFNFPIEFSGKYQPEKVPFPEGSEEDDQWIPAVFKDLTEEERKGIIASYYTSVEYVDSNVGRVMEALKENGLEENTLVIYIGDHGYLLNDHKRFEKHMMWEPAINAPLIVRGYGEKGKVFSTFVEYVDLVPTILEILENPGNQEIQGKSFVPVLEGKTENHRSQVFSEFLADNKAMIKNEQWKYIFSTGQRDLGQGYATGNPPTGIQHRLYNQIEDPDETTDLGGKKEYKSTLDSMKQELLKVFNETHPEAFKLPKGLSIDEKLVWFCEPRDKNKDLDAQ
ncbi:sulfatase family protein [Flexithrix dorotheae]|uniref:sulfatase family protein n=1 Tax=Flexithrix dorotheae TaxID=70993 RepID=UPI0012F99AC9|nr:sulfatase-like hydrolase/transferase [Flexithrix dorotheae]